MHDGVRRPVECQVEVFALLAGACDAAAGYGALEGGRGCAHFAVDDGVVVRGAGDDASVEGVFAQVVHDAGDFADLELLVGGRGGVGGGRVLFYLGHGCCCVEIWDY